MSARARGLPAGMDAPQKLHCRLLRAPHIIRLLPCVSTAHTKHMTKQHGVQTPTTRSLWVSGKTVVANGCPSFSRVLAGAGAGGVIAMCPPRTQLLPSRHPHADPSSPSGPQVSACLPSQDNAASPLHVPHPGDHQGLRIFAPQEGTQVEKRPELP